MDTIYNYYYDYNISRKQQASAITSKYGSQCSKGLFILVQHQHTEWQTRVHSLIIQQHIQCSLQKQLTCSHNHSLGNPISKGIPPALDPHNHKRLHNCKHSRPKAPDWINTVHTMARTMVFTCSMSARDNTKPVQCI